jgi:hypothetical protein
MSFFTLIPMPYRLLILAAVLAATFATGFIKGQEHEQGQAAIERLAEFSAVTKADKKARTEVAKVFDQGQAREEKERVVYRDVIKEVIRYAETDNGRAVCIGADWVRQHNRAADPTKDDTEARGASAVPAWEPTNAEALGVVVINYETCNQWRNDLIRWQGWYRASGLAEDR